MFRRKIENTMLSWKQSNNRKPLVIKGCRQCGKTSSVLEFARKHYKNVVFLTFMSIRSINLSSREHLMLILLS